MQFHLHFPVFPIFHWRFFSLCCPLCLPWLIGSRGKWVQIEVPRLTWSRMESHDCQRTSVRFYFLFSMCALRKMGKWFPQFQCTLPSSIFDFRSSFNVHSTYVHKPKSEITIVFIDFRFTPRFLKYFQLT